MFEGIKSLARAIVTGGIEAAPVQTGFAAYRATVDVEKMKDDPEISWLLEKASLNIWYLSILFIYRAQLTDAGLEKTDM